MNKDNFTKETIKYHTILYYKIKNKSPVQTDLSELPFNRSQVRKYFGTWNNMLTECKLPLNRNKPVELVCTECKIKFIRQAKELKKSKRFFCSHQCNAKYYTTGRKHTEETKQKISDSLKKHRIFIDKKK
jgi:hypothetical protein